MRKVVKLSVVLFSILMVTSVSAQNLSFGVKAGVNFSNMVADGNSGDMKIGPVAGVTVDYGITENLFLLTGLDLSVKGTKESDYDYSLTYNPLYLQIPIHVAYKFSVVEAENVKFVVEAGPYVAYGVAGKIKYKDDDGESDSSDLYGDLAPFKRFDFGVGAGIGLEVDKLKFSVGYDFGLANINDMFGDEDLKVNNRNFFITVGYRF